MVVVEVVNDSVADLVVNVNGVVVNDFCRSIVDEISLVVSVNSVAVVKLSLGVVFESDVVTAFDDNSVVAMVVFSGVVVVVDVNSE